jgi:hypothetical protein
MNNERHLCQEESGIVPIIPIEPMSKASRHIGFVILSVFLTLSSTSFGAKQPMAPATFTMSAWLAVQHNHVDNIALHANYANQHVMKHALHGQSEILKSQAELSQAEISGHATFIKADLAYVAKIALLVIIAGMALKTFREFRHAKVEEEENLQS